MGSDKSRTSDEEELPASLSSESDMMKTSQDSMTMKMKSRTELRTTEFKLWTQWWRRLKEKETGKRAGKKFLPFLQNTSRSRVKKNSMSSLSFDGLGRRNNWRLTRVNETDRQTHFSRPGETRREGKERKAYSIPGKERREGTKNPEKREEKRPPDTNPYWFSRREREKERERMRQSALHSFSHSFSHFTLALTLLCYFPYFLSWRQTRPGDVFAWNLVVREWKQLKHQPLHDLNDSYIRYYCLWRQNTKNQGVNQDRILWFQITLFLNFPQ